MIRNIRILAAYLKSKRGVEFTMGMLAVIIIIIIGLVLFALFLTGKWGELTGIFGKLGESALSEVPE